MRLGLGRTTSRSDMFAIACNAAFADGAHGRNRQCSCCDNRFRKPFRKPAQDLTVAQAAYLAAVPNAPERLRLDRPENRGSARRSRDRVLESMVRHGYLAPSAARLAERTQPA